MFCAKNVVSSSYNKNKLILVFHGESNVKKLKLNSDRKSETTDVLEVITISVFYDTQLILLKKIIQTWTNPDHELKYFPYKFVIGYRSHFMEIYSPLKFTQIEIFLNHSIAFKVRSNVYHCTNIVALQIKAKLKK